MGRRQKTTAQRAVDGSKSRPYHHEQPVPVSGDPVKPAHLSALASAQWDVLAGLLRGESRLNLSDALQIENAAHLYALAVRWQLVSDVTPMVAGERPDASHQQARLAWDTYRKACVELGLTQTSRSKAKGMGGQSGEVEKSPLERLREQRTKLRAVK